MDIALNHTTGENPLAKLYWNSSTNAPAANNPWLNVSATHPYNVFNDFNHESLATRYFTSMVVEHWLQEYKIDGFRFDLAKDLRKTHSAVVVPLTKPVLRNTMQTAWRSGKDIMTPVSLKQPAVM